MSLKVYIAHGMTGRTGEELLAESEYVAYMAKKFGIEVLDPVVSEGVKASSAPLRNGMNRLADYWRRDKRMIREAHVLLDVTGPRKSEGVAHEIGYARFALWKPVARLYPDLGPSIARFEDDVVEPTLTRAFRQIKKRWGTRRKRFVWRFKMLVRCLPKWLYYQVLEWK